VLILNELLSLNYKTLIFSFQDLKQSRFCCNQHMLKSMELKIQQVEDLIKSWSIPIVYIAISS